MKAIDTPALIQRIQEARASQGMTIRECAEKIGQPPYSVRIDPEHWARIERGDVPSQLEFCTQAAAMLGFEIPLIDSHESTERRYRCAPLSDEDRAELDRLTDQVNTFCTAKGVGLLLLTASNMTRSETETGMSEECLSSLMGANLYALPSSLAPLAHLMLAIAKDHKPMELRESLRQLAGYSQAMEHLVKESMKQIPPGDPVLEGFNGSRARFKT